MGNKTCCRLGNRDQALNQKVQNIDYNPQILPDLSQAIKKVLAQKKPFKQQLQAEPQKVTRKYDEEYYQGPVDIADRPSGYGKMYKANGSLVISHFKEGVSDGPSIYIFPDGSYYQGCLKDNKADDQNAYYFSQSVTYEGGFKQNAFSGKGKQTGQNYTFQGQYSQGRRIKGTLKWAQNQQQYYYSGHFNQKGNFTGHSILKTPKSKYQGQFVDGIKDGKGKCQFATGLVYEGDYRNGFKSGSGTVFNQDGTVAYSGQFANDLPNGQGYILQNNKKIYAQFKDGLDILTLPDEKK